MKKVYIVHYDSSSGDYFLGYATKKGALRGAKEWRKQIQTDHGTKWISNKGNTWESYGSDEWMSIVELDLND